jgi:hypothetical protein
LVTGLGDEEAIVDLHVGVADRRCGAVRLTRLARNVDSGKKFDLSILVDKPRDSPPGSTFDIRLSGICSTGKVRHWRPRSHVLWIATELLEPERPVGATEDIDTSKPI